MKKLLTIILALATTTVFSATTGTLIFNGTVPDVVSITVTPETIASNLPLNTTQNGTKVATLNEVSNSRTGYKVTVVSANNGNLKRTGGNEVFPYTISYAGYLGLALTSQIIFSNPAAAAVNTNKDFKISYTGVPADQMVSGDYTDTITFTIAVN